MTATDNNATPPDLSRLRRRIGWMRRLAASVIVAERGIVLLLPVLGVISLFLIASWFGLWRPLPAGVKIAALVAFALGFSASLLPLGRFRWPTPDEIDGRLEQKSSLRHQAIRVQDEAPATSDPFGLALWKAHQQRMAHKIGAIDSGGPSPDIARRDPYALRALAVLGLVVAWSFSLSNLGGRVSDAFTFSSPEAIAAASRIDAWLTPPAYTGAAPIYLTAQHGAKAPASKREEPVVAPQFSVLTVRVSGPAAEEEASFTPARSDKNVLLTPDKPTAANTAVKAPNSAPESVSYTVKLARDGAFALGATQFAFKITADAAPKIRFDKEPDRAVNGALEISFAAEDDYGIAEARAEIKPVDQDAKAIALFELPVFRLDVPGNSKTVKATASRDLTEHPLSGKKVAVTLIARDAAGHESRSETKTIMMPQRIFTQPLAGSIAEQRQVFALDVNQVPKALLLSEIAGFRADETIPNLSHYLMLESTRNRLRLANAVPGLEETAAYFWDVARYIEDGDLSNAEKRLRDAQQKLSEALSRNASDKEIEALMKELREAMKSYLTELAKRMGNPENNQMASQPQKMLRAQDIDKMLNQLENLARSGSREEAQKLLSEMQRMLNNLQTARPQNNRQQGDNPMRDQIDRLGELMQKQQKLMEETHRLEQSLRDRMQRGDPLDDQGLNNNEDPFQDMAPPGEDGQPQAGDQKDKEQSPEDKMTAGQLRDALKALRERQSQLQKDLKGMEKKLSELGMKPMPGFGEAGKEMGDSAEALGKSQGQRSADAQGRALEALRKGAGEMMQQLRQAGEGQGQGMGMPGQQADGADPLGRRPGQMGSDMDEQVKVPDQIDIQRAREILEEIRKRLGEGPASIIERDYLERLLDLK
ncbi:uncharacterized protein (TIGR02302 family) [Rhizobium sp. SG_E_25_P2]|uniref:TIGR02302 family protein n=1 Tax=Rhizobium sp. SG_E_25_P2 TaxID=2879942 RepID=UPI002474DD09|nr:TIGR02302 family protein [Rhizobium sp. SG_E_25_P2]MDH6267658.1 uncharacterized protein (TIGR02302 family) [Rhizobium sp. SG_E_25_P2]